MDRFSRYYPPGGSRSALNIALWGGAFMVCLIWIGYIIGGMDIWSGEEVNTFFDSFWSNGFIRFHIGLFLFLTLIQVLPNYLYFTLESQSIYVMRRITNPWELHLRCWSLPLLGILIICVYILLSYWLCCFSYLVYVPDGMMPEQQLGLFWRYVP